jgi:hypothetical protein
MTCTFIAMYLGSSKRRTAGSSVLEYYEFDDSFATEKDQPGSALCSLINSRRRIETGR